MRALSNFVWVACLLPLIIWSCSPMDQPTVLSQTAPMLVNPASGSAIVLSVDDREEDLVFQSSVPDFAAPGNITYRLEMALPGTNFANPVELGSADSPNILVKVENLNKRLLTAGLEPDVASNVEFRIKASIDRSLRDLTGDATTLSVTPYDEFVDLPAMYVPGDYQGWDPGNENTVILSVNRDNKFEGFVHILSGSGEFKVNETPSWDINYGSENGVDLVPDGPNLKITEFGTFKLSVDLDAKTFAIGPKFKWGLVGSATPNGWDGPDLPLTFDKDLNILKVTTDLAEGEMKFRANNDWDHNFGDTGLDGELDDDGANIPIPSAGNYTITMDFKVPGQVTYTLTKN